MPPFRTRPWAVVAALDVPEPALSCQGFPVRCWHGPSWAGLGLRWQRCCSG